MARPAGKADKKRIAIAMEIEDPYPHHQEVFAGVQRDASEHADWACVIDQHPTYGLRQRGASAGGFDGVIARAWPALRTRLAKLGVPLVTSSRMRAPSASTNARSSSKRS